MWQCTPSPSDSPDREERGGEGDEGDQAEKQRLANGTKAQDNGNGGLENEELNTKARKKINFLFHMVPAITTTTHGL